MLLTPELLEKCVTDAQKQEQPSQEAKEIVDNLISFAAMESYEFIMEYYGNYVANCAKKIAALGYMLYHNICDKGMFYAIRPKFEKEEKLQEFLNPELLKEMMELDDAALNTITCTQHQNGIEEIERIHAHLALNHHRSMKDNWDEFLAVLEYNTQKEIRCLAKELEQIARVTPISVTLADLIEGWYIAAQDTASNTNSYRTRNCQKLWLDATEMYNNRYGSTPHGDLSQTLLAWEAWITSGTVENTKILIKERDAIASAIPSQR